MTSDCGQSEELLLVEIVDGIAVRGRAGHDQKRHRLAVAPLQREDFLRVNLKQALV